MLQQYFPNIPAAISADAGLLILRIVVGLLFVGHGLQKLAGWFGGHGIAGTAGFFGSLGLKPAKFWAVMAGLAETLGGAGLALGLLTPFAAAAVIAVMLSAIAFVHWSKGIWAMDGGYEYNLVLLASAAVIGLMGAGAYSVDASLTRYGYALPLTTVQTFIVGAAAAVIALCVQILIARSGQRVAVQTGQHDGATTSAA
jgi:putative oxidoreductase